MKLIPWKSKNEQTVLSPAGSLLRMRQEMDDWLNRLWQDPWSPWPENTGLSLAAPRMDMTETDEELALSFELPGVNADDVNISVSGNVLTLRGEKGEAKEEKHGEYTYRERIFGSFSRSVQLPTSVNADKVDATFKDGVLTVKLAKRAEAKPRKIAVRQT